MQTPTMRINATNPDEQGAFVIINKSDFDSETMTEYVEIEQVEEDLTVQQMRDRLAELNIKIPDGAKKADLKSLLAETE